MKNFLPALFLLLCLPFAGLQAQDISTHIPSRATFIITINPAAHVKNGDVLELNQLELFTRTSEFGKSYDFLYGDEDLDEEPRLAFSQLFSDIFSTPQLTGVDTARKMFIFNDEPDSVHYWAYILPLNNSAAFTEYVTTKLFKTKPEVSKGSGFSSVTADRISVGWTKTYAIILLADYDYEFYPSEETRYELVRTRDSIAAAEAMAEEKARLSDTLINDSIRLARTEALMKEAKEMEEMLAKDTLPEEYIFDPLYFYNEESHWMREMERERKRLDSTVAAMASLQLKQLINLSYEESVESVANFRSVMTENFDAIYWYNYGQKMQDYYEQNVSLRRRYYEVFGNASGADTTIKNMWKGSYVVSLVRFQGDVATMEQRSYFSPELQQHTKGLYAGRVDKKMFSYVKGENLMGFVAMSVDMEKFMKFYGSVYRESMSNSFMGMYEPYYLMMWDLLRVFLDEETMYNLFDGQFLFAVTDLKPYTSSYVTYDYDENFNRTEVRKEHTEIRPEFIFLAGIGKKDKAQQILAILERTGAVRKQNNLYYLINTPGEYDVKLFLALHKGMLIVTNNEELMLNNLEKGYPKNKQLKRNLRKLGRRSALVGWWDGQKSFELVKKNRLEYLSEDDKESLDVLEQNVNSGIVLGKKSKKGVQRIEVKIELNESKDGKKSTSFVRFFRLLNSLFLVRQ